MTRFFRSLVLFSFCGLAAALFAVSSFAQTGTTSVRGTVTDRSGAAIVAAKVTLSNGAQGLERTASTNESGAYEFLSLPPGTYLLTVETAGFRKYEQKNLQLLVDSPATANVVLDVGSTTETIEVSAQAQNINTTDASLGIAFGENQVKQLPLEGRNVPDLLTLQAGVVYTGNRTDVDRDKDTRSGSVNGARSDQSNVTLDGVDVNDQTKGSAFSSVLPVSLDSVQEFRVTTTNYNADEGRSSGAQVSLVTKSGTNQFHGSLYEYHRNTLTSANDYFVKLAELQSGNSNTPPKLIRNIFGGSLGGPIKKDRLFFFVNYEGYRQREEASVVRIVPSAALRDGIIQYQCSVASACPGGTVTGASGTSYTVPSGVFALSPSQIKGMDPLNIGPSSIVMNYFHTLPLPNDNSQGDGLNFSGYRFRGPVPTNNNWYIARADYNLTNSGSHKLFWRGALRNDVHSDVPYLPGDPSLHSQVDYSKGFSLGYVAVLRPTLINNFRWGYTRQSFGNAGSNSTDAFIEFRNLTDNNTSNNSSLAFTRSQSYQVPIHNLIDDVSWTHGTHTWQFGTNVGFLRSPRSSTLSSFSRGVTNASWLDTAAMANTNSPGHLDPGCSTGSGACSASHYPAVSTGFGTSYDYPLIALLGAVTEVDAQYNFGKDGTALAQGAPLKRNFAENSYEFYGQDTWKLRPTLTITLGLRWSLFSPIWETNGVEVAPTISLSDWFNQRRANMLQGIGSGADALISYDLAGPANHRPGYYNWDYKDLGPRFAFAWSPAPHEGLWKSIFGESGKTAIRGGFGIVYDRFGQGLINSFDQRGSFGLSTQLTNKGGVQTLASAPRLTGLNTIPTTDNNGNTIFAPAPPAGFPTSFPSGGEVGAYAVTAGLDNKIRTPYSYTLDLSVARELSRGFSIEVSYVGRLSRRLLTQSDLAQPLNLVDPKSGIDYFTAIQALAKLYRQGIPVNQITPAMVGPTAVYWTDMTQALKPGGAYSMPSPTVGACGNFVTTDPLQANYFLFSCNSGNETTAQQDLDQFGFPDPNHAGTNYFASPGPNAYTNSQYASLYAYRSIGNATYHAMEVSFRKAMSHGLQFDLNYTYSKSIDLSSDAERVGFLGGLGGLVVNAWDPNQLRAVSDFDLTHQINANWIAELPFGKNHWIGRDSGKVLDAVIGGWQLSGLARWTSGFPFSVGNGSAWATDWEINGPAQQTGAASTHTTKNPDGSVNVFGDPTTTLNAFRRIFPGESGTRNSVRGDGFAGLDLGLAKRWKMPWKDSQSLQFRWEVFNALNLTRFDAQSVTSTIDSGLPPTGAFGNYSGLLTNPRVMQFALRFEF